MPRTARVAPEGCVYHILTRGNNRQTVFGDEKDYEKYIEILRKYKKKYGFRLYHYVLMTNHVHLVLEPIREGGSLAEIMKGVNLSYAQYYKSRYKHVGHFWQDRYKSIIVSKDQHLLACGSYVELNPVRAGIVRDPRDYGWSSYNVYGYGQTNSVLDEHPIYREQAEGELERRREYREFVMGMLKEKGAMAGEMERRIVYAGEDFMEKLAKEYEVERVIRPRGRPRKDEEKKK